MVFFLDGIIHWVLIYFLLGFLTVLASNWYYYHVTGCFVPPFAGRHNFFLWPCTWATALALVLGRVTRKLAGK